MHLIIVILVIVVFFCVCKIKSLEKSISSLDQITWILNDRCTALEKQLNELSVDDITKEAKQIATSKGYSIKPDTYSELMNGDSGVYELMKDACIKGGYSLKELESNEETKYVSFELQEKSKINNGNIYLGLLIKNKKIVGSYLNYIGYEDNYKPINFTGNMK